MKRKGKRRRRGVLYILLLLCILGICCFLLALGGLAYAEKHPGPVSHQTDAIIVLGAQVYADGTLSPQLLLRMEAAYASWLEKPRPIICCGAQGSNEPIAEGLAMQAWLLAQGVPEGEAFAEIHSFDTIENLKNAAQFLPDDAKTVTVVTSDYHLPRAMRLAEDLGYTAEGIGSPCKPEYWAKNHFREVLAWGKYCLHRLGIIH